MAGMKKNPGIVHDPLWNKDAIIYQTHVKAFYDSNDDGIGDFRGLAKKLDFIQGLGVNAIWLLPFYPSPMRDDGYDIADYRNVAEAYGSKTDFKAFVREAHRRGVRVITDLVINHTSDQHPWFQAARRAPRGSRKRNFYVWSDDDHKFPETRIIFTDSERSNWAWDEVAGQYFWHRFFSHQPDLNHNNPEVVKAVIRVMRYWLDMGVDGLCLDAIPYLCVREGTDNENLPETHQVLKQMRRVIDEHYQDVVFLAEANQWPEDVREYFGEGDECHMAYHFPLMPRMYMAIAQEDRHPIIEIIRQTPEIPENCQWAIFLRYHDELTLEMVTDRERDYMYSMYAAEPRMRINVGIRRRLAPLMGDNRAKIELMTSLLMTMPGSPILYYGDELGMGDHIFLGDRNGVRTPMQWTPDRNAGFSRADPQRLYLPPNMDPVYGYQAINVEAQERSPSSLLNWTKRLIAVRKRYRAFGRGDLRFLRPGNRKILAYLRCHEDEIIFCVANLSHSPQPVELDLSAFSGRVPVELTASSVFPPIGELPYLLTLQPYGFYVFRLATDVDVPIWHEEYAHLEDLPVVVLLEGWQTFGGLRGDASQVRQLLASRTRAQLQNEVLMPYIETKRWYAAKGQPIAQVQLRTQSEWQTPYDGRLRFFPTSAFAEGTRGALEQPVRHPGLEQSNTSVFFGNQLFLRVYRRLQVGVNPELEMGRYLTETQPLNQVAPVLGGIEYTTAQGEVMTLALLQGYVGNQGDAWAYTLNYLERYLSGFAAAPPESLEPPHQAYLVLMETLGRRIGELHRALGQPSEDPLFNPEPVSPEERGEWITQIRKDVATTFSALHQRREALPSELVEAVDRLLQHQQDLIRRIDAAEASDRALQKCRYHGDLHLGQVLLVENDFVIIDFEGEPARPIETRRAKGPVLRDVAGMLRSFNYAAHPALRNAVIDHPEERPEIAALLREWETASGEVFLRGYREAIGVDAPGPAPGEPLAQLFLIEKALYEIRYELNNRPTWLNVPVAGLLDILAVAALE